MKAKYESNEERIAEFKELAELLMHDDADRTLPTNGRPKAHSDDFDVALPNGDSQS